MKKILVISSVAILLGGLAAAGYWYKSESNNFSADERFINDSSSSGEGVKLVFVDSVSGLRIRGTKVTIVRLVSAELTETFAQGKTDTNGVYFLNLNQWNQWSPLTVRVDRYFPIIGKFSNSNNRPKNGDTLLLELQSDSLVNHRLYKIVDQSGSELKNRSMRIDVNTCLYKDKCMDLNNTIIQSNILGNIIIPTKYLIAGVIFEIDGYEIVEVDSNLRNQLDEITFTMN